MIDLDELDRMSARDGFIRLTAAEVREMVEEMRLLRNLEMVLRSTARALTYGENHSLKHLDAWRASK